MPVGDIVAPGAVVIDDRHRHGIEAAGERDADAPQAGNADRAVAQRRAGERIGAVACPFAGAQVPLGSGELAHGHQQEAQRGVGDLLGQHVGRIGDDDAARRAGGEIDAVIADAEIGDDL